VVITLCYLTSRRDCKLEWWLDSLRLQIKPEDEIHIVIVDFWAKHRATLPGINPAPAAVDDDIVTYVKSLRHVEPKPNVWQGQHRLTKEDWFAAANARNTALCLCRTDWLAYCDDLSVLAPTWLEAVRRAVAGNYVALGAYKKVRNLVVEKGIIKSFEEFPGGLDSRLRHPGEVVSCGGDWMYGCSVAAPVEAFLCVNGWPEAFDGLSFEDVCMGIAIGNTNKFSFRYDKSMLTLESEEHHYIEKPMKRSDFGVSPKDKSHAALNIAKSSRWFPNYFGDEGIRGLRQRVLNGDPFPTLQCPQHCWFTGRPIAEL